MKRQRLPWRQVPPSLTTRPSQLYSRSVSPSASGRTRPPRCILPINNELQLIDQPSSSIPAPTATFSMTRNFSPNSSQSLLISPQQEKYLLFKVEMEVGGGEALIPRAATAQPSHLSCLMSPTALTPIAISPHTLSFPSRRNVFPSTQLDRAIVLSLLDSSVTTDVLLTGSDHISRR